MSSLFSKPKSIDPPPIPPPPAIPEIGPDTADFASRQAKRRKGFSKTNLTGAMEPGATGKKSVLG